MQQTETYKLNKPETTDVFTPAPLNENADKLEAALTRVDETTADLDQRVHVLELRKFAVGTYDGDSKESQFVNLGFTPEVLIVSWARAETYIGLALPGHAGGNSFAVVENGFQAYQKGGFNSHNSTYYYFAMG